MRLRSRALLRLLLFADLAKDHLAGNSLVHTCHRNVNDLASVTSTTFNDDHCTVFEITNTLVWVTALLDNLYFERFTRQCDRADSLRELVYVQNTNCFDCGDLGEVV